jgi:hypothetical protein
MRWAILAPLDGFLVHLARGWRLPFFVEPCGGAHGAYSILLERGDAP